MLLYVWAVQKYPNFKGWIATSSIVLNGLQVSYLLVDDLRDVGGPLIEAVSGVFSFGSFDFSVGLSECAFPVDSILGLTGYCTRATCTRPSF